MAKHFQTIHRLIADELLECVWPFCRLVKGLMSLFASLPAGNSTGKGVSRFCMNPTFKLRLLYPVKDATQLDRYTIGLRSNSSIRKAVKKN